jgi:SAM-dependent methyltransferase
MTGVDVECFFDAIAGRYERSYALAADESRRRMAAVLGELPTPPARVLDLGVGTGRELTTLLDAGYLPTGIDISKRMLERCARRARPVPLVRADLWQPLPFSKGSFDAAVALHGTLVHSPDGGALARLACELARVVNAGGRWVVEIPSPAWLERLEDVTGNRSDWGLRRTAADACVYEDHVVGAAVEARVPSEEQWRTALAPNWTVRINPLGECEWQVVATRV